MFSSLTLNITNCSKINTNHSNSERNGPQIIKERNTIQTDDILETGELEVTPIWQLK